ncbi:MAG TPA: alpha-L-fucosidase [Puia sp.]|nr:alpha-L-fucosidase [Puia sp.]
MKNLLSLLIILFFAFSAFPQASYTPSPENLQARKWFDSARFGMFIHWGAFSVPGDGEWVMNNRRIRVDEYKRLLQIFNPVDFDARKWVSTAKNAGMQYITLITRHHDGFSDWDTKQSDWKITNTHWGKDAVKLIADECHKQGIRLFVYYSLLDWYREDYPHETGRTGQATGRTGKGNYESYLQFMKNQLTELLTNYGEISGVWFDGYWDQTAPEGAADRSPRINWRLDEIYTLIHKLQPQCLIGNNHHLSPFPGEDFQMFERDLPGENKSGLSYQEASTKMPLETCETLNDSWGFNIADRNYKSTKELVRLLVKDAALGANLLLNIGPLPNGDIQPEFTERLNGIGEWLKTYGPTIYGTHAGFIRPQDWGAVTEKGNKIYLHIFKSDADKFFIKLPYKVKSAKLFATNKELKIQFLQDDYIMIDLKNVDISPVDTVVEIDKVK